MIEIESGDGKFAFWKSAATAAFFDAIKPGMEVAIAYRGEKKIPGQRNTMHDFAAGIKPRTGKGSRGKRV
jgi:hypothetical protein